MALLSEIYPLQTGPSGATGPVGSTGPIGATGPQGNIGVTGATGPIPEGLFYATGDQVISGEKTFLADNFVFSGANVQFIEGTGTVSGTWNFQVRPTLNNHGLISANDLSGLAQNVIPAESGVYDLGTSAKPFKDLYLSSGSLYLGEAVITASGTSVVLPQNTVIAGGGTLGATGPEGATGPAGTDGATGATGTAGADGATGATGTAGADGATGATGTAGADGATGATGTAGADGATGATGTAGSQGSTGATGPAGTNGATGATGLTPYNAVIVADAGSTAVRGTYTERGVVDSKPYYNLVGQSSSSTLNVVRWDTANTIWVLYDNSGTPMYTSSQNTAFPWLATVWSDDNGSLPVPSFTASYIGPVGATGATGAQGATGNTGTQGSTGATGVQGATGATGNTGGQGATGATGDTGSQGATGATGNTGSQGATGATGNTGGQGATGSTGAAGDKYTTTSTTSESIGTGSKTFTVDSGLALSIGQQVIVAYDASNKMEGSVTSYSGTTLIVNVTSVTGSGGPYTSWSISLSGAPGPAGATGLQGATGNTGTQGATGATGNTGTQGATGATGNTGTQGATGATGNTGTQGATGATGNTGTQGATGATGNTGLRGATGETGSQGSTGATGVGTQGATGATGVGTQGATGATGTAGTNGATGATGEAGSQGATGATGTAGADGATGATGNTGGEGATGATGTAGTALALARYSWNSGSGAAAYFNLSNTTDNTMRFTTEDFNTDSGTFELINGGTSTARIHVKSAGFYQFISQVHLFDLFNNVDVVVKLLRHETSGGAGSPVTLFSDAKFAELTADQMIEGTLLINVTSAGFYSVVVNPSANSPFLSASDSSPTRLSIIKLRN